MTTSRERVLDALNFRPVDRVPKDLGGMRSTSISAFAYPRLVAALNLPPRRPKLEDTWQMLALPDLDVLDALNIDVVTILGGVTNAFEQPEQWHPYDFNGRLEALVRYPEKFRAEPGGVIWQGQNLRMVPESYVFDEAHGGQPIDFSVDLPKPDLKEYADWLKTQQLSDEQIERIRNVCQQARAASDRAIFFNDAALQVPIGIGGYGGLGIFPILCITEPNYVADLHGIVTEHYLSNIQLLLPEIAPYIDIIMMAADDWGTQRQLIASPRVFKQLFLPYYRRLNDACHAIAPEVKLFLHCCGAVYDLIDLIIEAGFDVLNPVQWTAGGRSYQEWKDRCRGRIALWGGGVNAQQTLPLGSVEEVYQEARQVVQTMAQGSGYVFCNIHNILAEIEPEKVIAMYRAADAGVNE